ncbi:unnamed protein product, partial [Prorocentrum cordatum]
GEAERLEQARLARAASWRCQRGPQRRCLRLLRESAVVEASAEARRRRRPRRSDVDVAVLQLLEVRLGRDLPEARLQRLEALQGHHLLEAAERQRLEALLEALAGALGLGEASLERPPRQEALQEVCPLAELQADRPWGRWLALAGPWEAWCPLQMLQVSLLGLALEWLEAEPPLVLDALASESPPTALLELQCHHTPQLSESLVERQRPEDLYHQVLAVARPLSWVTALPRAAPPLEQCQACHLAAVPPGGAGPWVHGPSSPMAYQRLGLAPGCVLEGVALDNFGSAAGTALFQVQSVWPGDGMGCFVEAAFMGCSSASLWPMLAGSFTSLGGAVLHLCTQQAGVCVCAGLVQWPQRSVLHVETYRMRSPSSLTEAWVQQPGGANSGAAAGAPAAALPAAAPFAPGSPAAQPAPGGLQKKIAELKKRLHQKRSIGETLTDRAEVPGALLPSGMEHIKKYIARRGWADGQESLGELATSVVQYITSVWHGHHPKNEMGVRSVREMRTVGECLDALLRGELDHLGDLLMQRLKAIEQATRDGRWQVAQHLELCDDLGVGLARQEEVHDAVSKHRRMHGLAESVAKAKKGSGN